MGKKKNRPGLFIDWFCLPGAKQHDLRDIWVRRTVPKKKMLYITFETMVC